MGIFIHIHDIPMTSPPYSHHIPTISHVNPGVFAASPSSVQDVWGWTIAACGSGVVLSAVGTPFENLLAWHVAERSKAQPRGCWDRKQYFFFFFAGSVKTGVMHGKCICICICIIYIHYIFIYLFIYLFIICFFTLLYM